MKIESSDILMSSQHSSMEQHTVRESLRMWVGDRRPDFEGRPPAMPRTDQVTLSSEGKAAQKSDAVADMQDAVDNDPRMQILISMVEALTGKKVKIMTMKDLKPAEAPSSGQFQGPRQASGEQQAAPTAGFGVEYERHESRYEAEQAQFSAQGVVKTADGKEISFTLQLSMSREHLEQTDLSMRLGDAARQKKDPLVINFNGSAAQLTSSKFSFDLDADGTAEKISFVGAGSGFLALDKNQDGKINDGSELFGPASGNGFGELAAYDQDGNHWIDENDAVFARLKVWTRDAGGNDRLASLKEAGVGALYLGNASSEFSLKDSNNRLEGQIRSSGVYLNEDGSAGSLQQIDLAV